jgi:malyl-CoA/(S)-citramalyl-CoA lyase
VGLANEVFGLKEEEVKKARRIIDAMAQAQKEGKGAVALDGKLIDNASIKQAQVLVQMAERAGIKA